MSYTKKFLELYKSGKTDDITIIKMAAFKEELEHFLSMEKTALGPAQAAGIAALMGVASGATAIGIDAIMDARERRELQDNATNVLEILRKDPEVAKFPKRNLEENFKSLYMVSPQIASNPVAAKSYLLNMLSWSDSPSGVPITHFSEMAKVEESISKSRGGGRGKSRGELLISPISNIAAKASPNDWLRE